MLQNEFEVPSNQLYFPNPYSPNQKGFSPFTSIPMLRAVPATILMADSMVKQLRSGIFISATLRTWSQVTDPTLFLFDSFDPLFIFAKSRS